jgi:hypothetical protein
MVYCNIRSYNGSAIRASYEQVLEENVVNVNDWLEEEGPNEFKI